MNDSASGDHAAGEGWDTYWHGARTSSAYSGGGSTHPAILEFWATRFADVGARYAPLRIVDIASGNGAVVESAQTAFGDTMPSFTCVDLSSSAIAMLQKRYPDVTGIVADARSIPLEAQSFDVATSQFGIEYAGLDAIDEVARLIAPGGEISLLLHHRDGGIYAQCAASRDAIESMRNARFIPLAIETFRQGFAAMQSGDRSGYQAAAKNFTPAIRAMEAIMRTHGRQVADDTIVRLYSDVRTMHERMRHYEPADVIGWLERMQEEIHAYSLRMASMCEAAVDAVSFDAFCDKLTDMGFRLQHREALMIPERNLPLAWAVVARRP